MGEQNIVNISHMWGTFIHVLEYIPVTLGLTFSSVGLGIVLGLCSSVVQLNKIPIVKQIADMFVLVCRSLPNMILLYIVYYGLPLVMLGIEQEWGIRLPYEKVSAYWVALLGLTLHTGAYLSEIFRASIQSVPKGQLEAALSTGMTLPQAYRRIVLPQAAVFALPLFTNQFLSTMKSTSIVFVITVVELLGAAKLYVEENSAYFEAYIVVAIIYWVMGIIFECIFARLEYGLSNYKRGNAV